MITITLKGKTVGESKNLRGIIDRSRKVAVDYVSVTAMEDGAAFSIFWVDGSNCLTFFNSLDLAHKFAKRYSK